MTKARSGLGIFLLAALALFTACSDDNGGATAPEDRVASVTVSPGSATLDAIDATQQFSADAEDANGNTISDVDFSWSTSAASVASVDHHGVATAAGNGTAQIIATVGGVADTADLTVSQAVATVEVTPTSSTIVGVDGTQTFSAEAIDSNGNSLTSQPSFSWSSSDQSIATVNSSGMATAVARGAAQITATASGVSDVADLTVEGILHWTDTNVSTSAVPGALDSLGVTATNASGSSDFVTKLQSGGWGLVVFGSQGNDTFAGSVQSELEGYVTDGGKLLAVTFSSTSALVDFMRASAAGSNYSDLLSGSHPIFDGLPTSIGLTNPGYVTYAQSYTANPGGECLGGTSAGDCGAILGHGDRTLLLGPLFDTYTTQTVGEELLAQAMEFLISVSPPSSPSAASVLDYDRTVPPGQEDVSNLPSGGGR